MSRSTVVRVIGAMDAAALPALRNILNDLVHNHDVTDLAIDLTAARALTAELSELLSRLQQRVAASGGRLEIRLADSGDIPAMSDLPVEVPAFVAVDPEERAGHD